MYYNQSEKSFPDPGPKKYSEKQKNKHFFSIEGKFAMRPLWAMNQCSETKDAFYFYDSAFTSEEIYAWITDSLETMCSGCDDGVHERVTESLIIVRSNVRQIRIRNANLGFYELIASIWTAFRQICTPPSNTLSFMYPQICTSSFFPFLSPNKGNIFTFQDF